MARSLQNGDLNVTSGRGGEGVCASITLEESALSISLACFIIANTLGSVNLTLIGGIGKSSISLALQIFGLGILVLGYLPRRFEQRETALFTVGLVIGIGTLFVAKVTTILWLVLLSGLGAASTTRRLARVVCIVSGVMLALVIVGNFLGLIPSVLFSGERTRTSLGFAHPNNLGMMVLVFYVSLTTSAGSHHPIRILLLGIALTGFLLATSETRTVAFLLPLYWLVLVLFERGRWLQRHGRGIVLFIFWLSLILSFMLVALYRAGSPMAYRLDALLSGRIYYSTYYLNLYFPTLFGVDANQMVPPMSVMGAYRLTTTIVLDCSYIRLFVQFGVLPAIMFIVYVTLGVKKTSFDPLLMAGLTVIFVYAVSENCLYSPMVNFFLIPVFGKLFGSEPSSGERLTYSGLRW